MGLKLCRGERVGDIFYIALKTEALLFFILNEKIQFTDIPRINESVLEEHPWIEEPSLEDLLELDEWVKNYVTTY